MVEKEIWSGIRAIANSKYMKNYDKNITSSHLMHLDVSDLYAWGMSQKLSLKTVLNE